MFFGGRIGVIDDFQSLKVYGKSTTEKKSKGMDKGHAQEVAAFLHSIQTGSPCPIPFEQQYNSFKATFKVMQSIAANGERIIV